MNTTAEDVFMGNGVSELILFSLRALLNEGDEVLVPSPDYPLWTAATHLNDGKAVHYPCPARAQLLPDLEAMAKLSRRAHALWSSSRPTTPPGQSIRAKFCRPWLSWRRSTSWWSSPTRSTTRLPTTVPGTRRLATLVKHTLSALFGSVQVYRSCGFRVGWLSFSGEKDHAREYLLGLDTLMSLRLCRTCGPVGRCKPRWGLPVQSTT